MAATLSVSGVSHLPGGDVIVHGTATIGTYTTGGVTMDLSDYISAADNPTVVISGDDGFVPAHNRGNAEAGVILMYAQTDTNNAAALQISNASNLAAVICPFFAIGSAPTD